MENIRYKEIDYFKECCIYIQNKYAPNSTIGGIRSQIDKSVKFNKPYKNLTFIKEWFNLQKSNDYRKDNIKSYRFYMNNRVEYIQGVIPCLEVRST